MHIIEDQIFEFGEFVLAPRERLLLRRGHPVPLTPKAFDLLVGLVRRSGHLVSKDDLMREAWPDTFVQEVNLTVNISALRKVLESDRDGHGMIQTVPTRGYRFIAPVVARDLSAAQMSGQNTRQLPHRLTHSADAFRAYLRGRHEWSRKSEQALKRAIEAFECAVEADPRFAVAHSGLADCYATLGYLSHLAPVEAFPIANRHAMKALELEESHAEAHSSLGFVKLYFEWDWLAAEAEFQRAIALNSGHAQSHEWYSIYLLAAGRPADAFREIEAARGYDPLSLSINSDLGFHHYYTGQYDEAIKQLQFVIELNESFAPAHLWLGRTYQELGRFDDALAEFQQVEEILPQWPVSIAARGFVAGAAGRTGEAKAILKELETLAARKFVTSYGVALVHAGLGENEAAFAWLNRAFSERSNWLVWLRLDPRWKGLRSDKRFAGLVGRMNFPN